MAATYRYAFDRNGVMHDSADLTHAIREASAPFNCVGCGSEMLARIGAIRVRHFAHRVDGACSPETYLHRSAKRVFTTAFRKCVESRLPYILWFDGAEQCRHFHALLGIECVTEKVLSLDLTKYFDSATEEGAHEQFRADVLLRSSRGSKVLMFEFAVAHPCDEAKVRSGIPIVEVFIRGEPDVLALAGNVLGVGGGPETRLHNFGRRKKRQVDCYGNCTREVLMFLVHRGGKCILATQTCTEARDWIQGRGALLAECLGFANISAKEKGAIFRRQIREASLRGIDLRNCYACSHHRVGSDRTILCTKTFIQVESNAAAECDHFDRVSSSAAFDALEAKKRQHLRDGDLGLDR